MQPPYSQLASETRTLHNRAVKSLPENHTMADRLLYALEVRGMSGRQLGRESGAHASLVSQYTRGILTNPKIETVSAFASVLGVSVRWLIRGAGDMEDPADIPPRVVRQPRTYGDLPGWEDAEREALKIVPHLDWAIVGVRKAPVDEKPQMLTATWIAYRAERFAHEEHTDEERIALDRQARSEARKPAKSVTQSGTHRTPNVRSRR